MTYSEMVRSLLASMDAQEGDTVNVRTGGREYQGVLMPHHEFSSADVIVIKLKSGYNIGIRLDEQSSVRTVKKVKGRTLRTSKMVKNKELKDIAVLGTGGTIASYVDYRTGAVHPALKAEELVGTVPEISTICNVRSKVVFSIFSENMNAEHWRILAEEAADELNSGTEGVLVPHGTDTMGYTSAALSFMLGDVPRPVVLVGAQRSSDRPSSDAYTNLLAATRFCVDGDAAETFVLMHSSTSDISASVHRGTKVRKMHTSTRDAFQSINARPVAAIDFTGVIEYHEAYAKKSDLKVAPKVDMAEDVALLFYYPGMSPAMIERIMESNEGLVIAGTGLGHVSRSMLDVLKAQVNKGKPVVMTSQCLNGRVNLNVYDTGRDLLLAGVIPGEDMLPETALVKLMWVLGQTDDMDEVVGLMTTDLRGEITERRESDA